MDLTNPDVWQDTRQDVWQDKTKTIHDKADKPENKKTKAYAGGGYIQN